MGSVKVGPIENFSKDFVSKDFSVNKSDRYFFRNQQSNKEYRPLTSIEIEILIKNNNIVESWEKILVSENFDPSLVRNCEFWGMVRIGNLEKKFLSYKKLRLPVGIMNSMIVSTDIGDNAVIRNVHFLSHYIIGNNCILFNIDEMITSDNAKFGNGIVKDGEDEDLRLWLEIANENGGRSILPFEGILPADAFLWSQFRDEQKLLTRLIEFTDKLGDKRHGYYGTVGDNSVIKDSLIIKDCKIGSNCYIKGVNKIKNLTIQSSPEEPTQIGEGCELVNGIIGFGNRIFYGAKCIRFVTGRNVQVKYGARLIHSFLGANSTISCCEVLNNLIYPFHEQHHNNSFLIASTVLGQSNIAAGATIGSNHNSRAADGEIIAGRGFWPGLESSYKHNSVFASFTLVAKGAYETELNVKLPFSLLSKNPDSGMLQIFPAFWFRYNMYALARNSWKFKNRDKRVIKEQNIEMDFLAPDTAMEMLAGITTIEQAIKEKTGSVPFVDEKDFTKKSEINDIYLLDMAPKEKVLIIKPIQAIWLYKLMLSYFAAKEILNLIQNDNNFDLPSTLSDNLELENWMNFGGQLISETDYKNLLDDIKGNKLDSWESIHLRYSDLWKRYDRQKASVAIQCWLKKEGKSKTNVSKNDLIDLLKSSVKIDYLILQWAEESRLKDYTNPFRQSTYRNKEEMDAVLGKYEENSFLSEMKNEHEKFTKAVEAAVTVLKKN